MYRKLLEFKIWIDKMKPSILKVSLDLFEISFAKEIVNFAKNVIGQNKSGTTSKAKSK